MTEVIHNGTTYTITKAYNMGNEYEFGGGGAKYCVDYSIVGGGGGGGGGLIDWNCYGGGGFSGGGGGGGEVKFGNINVQGVIKVFLGAGGDGGGANGGAIGHDFNFTAGTDGCPSCLTYMGNTIISLGGCRGGTNGGGNSGSGCTSCGLRGGGAGGNGQNNCGGIGVCGIGGGGGGAGDCNGARDGGGAGGGYGSGGSNGENGGGGGGGYGGVSSGSFVGGGGGCGGKGVAFICYPTDGSYGGVMGIGGDCCYECNGYCVHKFINNGAFILVN